MAKTITTVMNILVARMFAFVRSRISDLLRKLTDRNNGLGFFVEPFQWLELLLLLPVNRNGFLGDLIFCVLPVEWYKLTNARVYMIAMKQSGKAYCTRKRHPV
jgi:hypothetical protein